MGGDFTRESLAMTTQKSLLGGRVLGELQALCVQRGYPKSIALDNDMELIIRGCLDGVNKRGLIGSLSNPGSQYKNHFMSASKRN